MSADAAPGIDPIFITAQQAAAALTVHVASIYALLDTQKVKSQYFGRRRLVDVESLREYAKNLPIYPAGPVS